MPRISNNYPTSGLPQGQATKAKPTPTSKPKPKPKTSTSKNENKLGPAGLVSTSSAAAASRYAGLDPTRGRGMGGVEYTPKVLDQMRVNARTGLPDNHGFPRIADNSARLGDSFAIRNGDGKIRGGIELKGHYNGKPGKFQWIVEPGGKQSNHRLFVPKGRPSPIPANAIIRGTGAARVAGRVMLPVGLALDGYEVATAKNKPKKLTEKVGAWGGAFAASGATAQAAAPLLAAGPVGWVGYGAAVVGAGALGYFGGEKLGGAIYSFFGGN